MTSDLVDRPATPLTSGTEVPDEPRPLSRRELDVLALVAEGCLNREIAERLDLSHNTVKTYVRTAYRKIGVVHRAQAIRWCLDDRGGGVRSHGGRLPVMAEALP